MILFSKKKSTMSKVIIMRSLVKKSSTNGNFRKRFAGFEQGNGDEVPN